MILPDYGSSDVLSTKHTEEYIERMKKLREEKENFENYQKTKPGTGANFYKNFKRVTVPKRTLLYSENVESLRDVKNSIKSVKKPIAPHKFLIGYDREKIRKNAFRISKNVSLTSDEVDKMIKNLNPNNHNNLVTVPDGISYSQAVKTLHNELKKINI